MSSDPTAEFELVSPCVGICQMDPATGLCRGCWRTIDEIASWSALDRDGRLAILQRLRDRRRAAGQDRRRVNARRAGRPSVGEG
ncbi:MAG: DUF1289 domain-containing protein [Alphaproteobacteria bacterium]|nr:DUF1289 domain-containing protein [Alphaproteobacteria bacterium]